MNGVPVVGEAWRVPRLEWPAPLTIGVVSDTHLYAASARSRLPGALLTELAAAGVACILHAGDILAPWVLDRLEEIAPVIAVYGNGDPPELRAALAPSRVVTAGPHSIGLIHGHEGRGPTTPHRALRAFSAQHQVRTVIFGHSHRPMSALIDGVLAFNPGSPTDKRLQPLYSFGLLRVTDTVEPELACFR